MNEDLKVLNKQSEKIEEDPINESIRKIEQKKQREAILREQKRKRREKELEEQLNAQKDKQKMEDNMRRLKAELAIQKIQNLENLKKAQEEREAQKKLREKSKPKKHQVKVPTADITEGHHPQTEQYLDLHDWIDEQIQRRSASKKSGKDSN